jgi:probable rRNA maturation factor
MVISGASRLVIWNKSALRTILMTFSAGDHYLADLHVSFATSKVMTSMNRMYRNKGRNTDVLSFPDEPSSGSSDGVAGTIYINPQVVLKKCRYDIDSAKRHFRRLIIHGLVHLFGYDHETDDEWREMRQLERYWLRRLPQSPLVTFK